MIKRNVTPRPYSYQLIEFLGEGLNSQVYRAAKVDSSAGVSQEVVLKILKSKKMVDIWRDEFNRLSVVKSRNCVALLGWEWIQDCPALVLELVEGVSLTELLRTDALSRSDFDLIYDQAARGLSDLAKAGVVHGDLNPNNIMIDVSGCVKLVDFGLHGAAGDVYVTPEFTHPSVLNGFPPSPETDAFSLDEIRRRYRSWMPEGEIPTSPSAIGLKVADRLRKRRLGALKTLLIKENSKALRAETRFNWPVLIMAILLLFGVGAHSLEGNFGISLIHVRTRDWVAVRIGKQERYAPTTFEVLGNRPIRLNFRSANGEGKSVLTVPSGDSIVLSDDYFRIRTTGDRSGSH